MKEIRPKRLKPSGGMLSESSKYLSLMWERPMFRVNELHSTADFNKTCVVVVDVAMETV